MASRRDSGSRPGSRPGRNRPTPGRGRGGTPRRRTTSAPASSSPETTPRKVSRNLTGRAAVVLLVLGALVVSYAQSLRVWFDQHQQITGLQKEIADREQRVGELEDEVSRWDDEAYVRAQARQRLGWVMPGEVGYRVIGADGKPVTTPAGTPSAGAEHTGDPTWYGKLWGSVQVAGTKPDPATKPSTKPATPPRSVITPPTGER
jgi:cell division protein FtsB